MNLKLKAHNFTILLNYSKFKDFVEIMMWSNYLVGSDGLIHHFTNLAGHALNTLDSITGKITDTINNRISKGRGNPRYYPYPGDDSYDGILNEAYNKQRDRFREGFQKLCKYFRRGRVYRGPCKKEEIESVTDDYKEKLVHTTPYYRTRAPPIKEDGHGHDGHTNEGHANRGVKYGSQCQTKEGLEGVCQPATYCFSQYNNVEDYLQNRCKLNNGISGICCVKEFRPPQERYRKSHICQTWY